MKIVLLKLILCRICVYISVHRKATRLINSTSKATGIMHLNLYESEIHNS